MHKRTYGRAAELAEFIFDALIKAQDMDHWNRLNKAFMDSLSYSDKIPKKEVNDCIRNGYIMCQNILAAAQSRNSTMIEISGNRRSRAKRAEVSDSDACDAAPGAESAGSAPGADGTTTASDSGGADSDEDFEPRSPSPSGHAARRWLDSRGGRAAPAAAGGARAAAAEVGGG
jgi:hypothetical protein